ncbi:MAG: hypothetical protein OXK17_05125 [Thaumarchaeota archaeon]|nr:hypothetical protein [Nitrososphaerota archaeon]
MNQIVQWVLIFGASGLFFGAFYLAGLGELSDRSESQLDRLSKYERQVLERIMVVEVVAQSPAAVDVINTGGAPMSINHVFANGSKPTSWATHVMNTTGNFSTAGVLPEGAIARISVSNGSTPLFVVTENDRTFMFGEDDQ